MELPLLAASLRSRNDFELVKDYINLKSSTYSKLFQIVMSKIGDYYARDGTAEMVLPDVLMAQVAESIRGEKNIDRMRELVSDALGNTSSDANVRAAILLAKQQEVADKLTMALSGGSGDADELLEQLMDLRRQTSIDGMAAEGMETYKNINLEALMAQEFDPDSIIKIYPSSLADRLDGGAKRGHHITIFGRPESMKSGTCINISGGCLRQNLRVGYFINEDRPEDIILRHVNNLSGMNKYEVRDNPVKAMQLADSVGFNNLVVINAAPGTPSQIQKKIDEEGFDVIIIDQLRNLSMKADNRVNQLEAAATAVRTLAKRNNVLAISVTQAGDSGDGKAVLEMGDIDYSNTGIPAQADVLIGVGVDPTLEAEQRRVISLPKNKISGRHEHFPVNVIPQLSRVVSV